MGEKTKRKLFFGIILAVISVSVCAILSLVNTARLDKLREDISNGLTME